MQSIVFCQAAPDLPFAHEIGEYLERNMAVAPTYEEGLITPEHDLFEAVGTALSAELVVAILSPDSVPTRWDRKIWEPALLKQPNEFGSRLFFVLARPCKFPELLKRQAFSDFNANPIDAKRSLKRQIFHGRPHFQSTFDLPQAIPGRSALEDVEGLRAQLGDQPGSATGVDWDTALTFAHAYKEDFEGAFWIDCADRTLAGIVGDMGHALGLALSGSAEQNQLALRKFHMERRCLFIYEHLDPKFYPTIDFGARASSLVTTPAARCPLRPLEEVNRIFASWVKNPGLCGLCLGDAHAHLEAQKKDWPALIRLGSPMLAFLKNAGRLAEANEALEILISAAEAHQDPDALHRFAWDQSWIFGHWGEPYNASAIPSSTSGEANQLYLDFG